MDDRENLLDLKPQRLPGGLPLTRVCGRIFGRWLDAGRKTGSEVLLLPKRFKNAMVVGGGTFFLAIGVSFISQYILAGIASLIVAFGLLVIVIFTGVFFDIIGVAATAAREAPLHARAAKKVRGARQAIYLVRNADRVASFSNDVVGDICGTLSGAIGAVIVQRLIARGWSVSNEIVLATIMTAAIAGVTVGGKAWGKGLAIEWCHDIIEYIGRAIDWLEGLVGRPVIGKLEKGKKRS